MLCSVAEEGDESGRTQARSAASARRTVANIGRNQPKARRLATEAAPNGRDQYPRPLAHVENRVCQRIDIS